MKSPRRGARDSTNVYGLAIAIIPIESEDRMPDSFAHLRDPSETNIGRLANRLAWLVLLVAVALGLVWRARQLGYTWKEISSWLGVTEQQAKMKFQYGLEKTRQSIVRVLKAGKPKESK